MLAQWWLWALGGLVLLGLTAILPDAILLGFAVAALVVGLLLLVGGPMAVALAGSPAMTLLIFAVLALVAWILLRRFLGVRRGQVKIWKRDINDD